MANIKVNEEKCVGCGQCKNVCPAGIYEIENGKAKVIPEKVKECMECHACEVSCPQKAIKIN